ncbi:MAG: DNA primase small subunit PriS [Methanomicrobiaceae archaeon]|uniref:DNA primase small subunit n=1 Tax=hydrocarbon metagenome TaxID=938273 RepID=A0A0W8FIR7_9ZZZZ|nr:DNA primase small subunit PriS [Methanomicrobiaceae archaeon]MDD5419653.1 DNA primase small subunit PriS [Methanomicrobiaceae archaeon]
MRPATLEFLKQRFTEYYEKGYLSEPSALSQREWGFIFFDASSEVRMRRHMAFADGRELRSYIRSMVPAHVYYSTAYYEMPGAPTMGEKFWTGADLIFDLDADHIMRGSYTDMLKRVQEETIKLIGMLTDELGFRHRDVSVVFSGGRGYHIHVRDIAIREWGSQERREVIDYVCGTGIDPGVMLSARPGMPGGWQRRYIDALREHLLWLSGLERGDAMRYLTGFERIGEKTASGFLDGIEPLLMHLQEYRTEGLSHNRMLRAIVAAEEGDLADRVREQAARADEPVTTDTRRLIRMPTSLHGGSGLRAAPLAVKDLPEFDPLVDAVVFGTRERKVDMRAALTMPILGNAYRLTKGVNRVPEALAVFVCCRGMAEIAGGGG